MQGSYHDWDDYDVIVYLAIEILKSRKCKNDEIDIEAAKSIEYVESNVERFEIQRASNTLKENTVSVKTLDLNQPFAEIANQMDRIVESHFSELTKTY